MKFSEYISIRGYRSFTKREASIFKMVDMSKGWVDRYRDFEIPQSSINKAVEYLQNNKRISDKVKARITKLTRDYSNEFGGQFLYMMQNSNGLLKIGVSIDPVRRARSITTGSGVYTKCVCIWDVAHETRSIESYLLRKFSHDNLHGEWFKAGSFSVEDVENNILCVYNRVSLPSTI